ncbi:polysaccharide biosynthesis/export family protein [Campylobacter coli]|uniref:polysaccharide biosynthesis/export family protein n=1 Tax=Campylobacter coli TaxID=195 RepID=UPI000257CFC8|nr:SLBB domain-containing protein [Campylobacter coli]EAJ1963733.1 polysaccharide export protein [Campylobacter coli]EAJ4319761.1 polysaccharide export protein [Campylobacter coli]EDO8938229.1 polysaccharide export protein [Campylobacter coli]EIA77664.1 capsular polysaccharide ABC transporter, periplasmic polysaccharide-binding protein [Campylobacter coli 1909]EIA82222.1 capsular polysaccharide ABC transporter, periplasmic polysaccharide-binding protein [Campylobacter coli 1957]
MKKILILFLSCIFCFGAIDVSQISSSGNSSTTSFVQGLENNISKSTPTQIPVFGAELFNGNFKNYTQRVYNPDYKIAVGDQISLKIWGAVEFEQILVVDSQGNIFIPKVGAVNLLGVKNSALVSVIKAQVNKIYKNNVFVYADMNAYQNVSVFVTGSVNAPGLYQGLSSDSVIQYLDKAGGINLEYGSFRDIQILRNNAVIKKIDLYDFLLKGQMDLFPFRSGDVVLVGNVQSYVFVNGDVQRPFRFELANDIKTLFDLARVAGAKPIVTNAILRSYGNDHKLEVSAYNKMQFSKVLLKTGDEVQFNPEYISQNISITVNGEHSGLKTLVVRKGTTLEDVSRLIVANGQSDMNALQVFRKSVAKTQKDLINAQLKELETLALTSPSVTSQGAAIKAEQAKLILEFIQRARELEPKGQIVIDKPKSYGEVILEEGDTINVPSKNNLIIVQGEVTLPGAFVYNRGEDLKYYINLAGGYGERADTSKVLVIRNNGKAQRYSGSVDMMPGDSVLVLPKVESENLQIFSMLTQILYQIAVATNVVLNL